MAATDTPEVTFGKPAHVRRRLRAIMALATLPLTLVLSAPRTALAARPAAPGVTTESVVMASAALGRDTTYTVLRPAALLPGRLYPVLYLLHGYAGDAHDWLDNTDIEDFHEGRPLIVVMPDGGRAGWYVDSPTSAAAAYETFVTRDLTADVEARFPASRARDGRAIAGLSMGGHGAITLAARHPALYRSASSVSGILRLTEHRAKWDLAATMGPLPGAEPFWRAHSADQLSDALTTAGVALMIDTGLDDRTGNLPGNRALHERLCNRGAAHVYVEFPGGHTWAYWNSRIGAHLNFHLAALAARPDPVPNPGPDPAVRDHYRNRTLAFETDNARRAGAVGAWWLSGDATTASLRARAEAAEASGPVVLFGSSSFEKLKRPELAPGRETLNRGISADTLGLDGGRGLLARIDCSVLGARPWAIVVQNGTNDLSVTSRTGRPTVEQAADGMAEIVRRLRAGAPWARVVLTACTPTRGRYAHVAPLVAAYDARLKALTAEGGGPDPMVRWADPTADLAAADGTLRAEYSTDGLHLTDAGEALLIRHIRDALGAGAATAATRRPAP